ncbi:aldo/keto reductase [Cribrihabitans neustonicus]|uniref:aldo/keto reductase n=1 Tax=Cribrihabitans neustonicus TaxID=1429085 RepID=UPI003B5AD1C9
MDRISLTDGLSFSRIAYGLWRIADGEDSSAAHITSKISACLDQGITTLDQADIYGGYLAEAIMGEALKAAPGLRQKIEIVSKCGIVAPSERYSTPVKHYNTSAAHIFGAAEQSLRDFGTDYLDLLLIHRPDPFMDHEETGRALDDLVAEGKIRAAGVSNFRPWDMDLLQSAMSQPLVTNQIELSLAELSAFTDGTLAALQQRRLPAMAWSPLGGGALMHGNSLLAARMDELAATNDADRAAIAVAFLLAHPARILPVMGTNSLDRIRRFSDALSISLSREEWFELYTLAQGKPVP